MWSVFDILMDHMVFDDWIDFDFGRYEGLPDDAPLEVMYLWLEEAVGKPFSAVAALSISLVENWGMVRGRLITSGIPDPMGQIRSLGAMLDAVEFMIMEGHKDEKEREKYKRQVYRPRRKTGKIEKPSGFESSDMAAQSAMLEALEG